MKKGELAIFVTMCVLSIVFVCIGLTIQGLHLSAVAVVFAIGCAIRQSWIDKFSKKIIGNIHNNPELLNK